MPKPTWASVEERFWAKVDKTDTCWVWTAGRFAAGGYGQFSLNNRPARAHCLSYEWAYGPIPDGLHVDHMCHNPPCVNPAHLRAVTNQQNHENLSGAYRTSKSGIRGVIWDKERNKWLAQVHHNKKHYLVGRYDSIAEAEAAVILRRNAMFTHNDLDRR